MDDENSQDQFYTVSSVENILKVFLENNPASCIEEEVHPSTNERNIVVRRPWGDRSVVLEIPDKIDDLAEALNNLVLPVRYSGMWHRDTKAFEILWTAFKIRGGAAELVGRSFSFRFREVEYKCEFSRTSERALVVAGVSMPTGQSDTSYRNLYSFETFVTKDAAPPLLERLGEPISFWIRDVEWDEDAVFALANHLNFYLTYFDASSPVIVLHSPPATASKKPTRYPADRFPNNISATEIDAHLLYLWQAAAAGEPMQRFLYYYRIIEYAAAGYLDSTARAAMRKALALPNALDDLHGLTEVLVATAQKMKNEEIVRYDTMLKEMVTPSILWREMNQNPGAFTTSTDFEGGFRVEPVMSEGRAEVTFTPNDVYVFGRAIRDIRNALSHGRDQKTGTTITPTTHNAAKLEPWIGPVRACASQVMLYKSVV